MKNSSLLDLYLDRHTPHPALRGTTGRIFEWELLGKCTVTTKQRMGYWAAVVFAREHQQPQYHPFMPFGEAGKLHRAVYREMGVEPRRLGMYSALGTSLDLHHKVDGFFILDGCMIVTFDLTVNPHKDCTKGEACVLITGEDAVLGYPSAAAAIARWFAKAMTYRCQKELAPCEVRAEQFRSGQKTNQPNKRRWWRGSR